jgi:hypothetical protein
MCGRFTKKYWHGNTRAVPADGALVDVAFAAHQFGLRRRAVRNPRSPYRLQPPLIDLLQGYGIIH